MADVSADTMARSDTAGTDLVLWPRLRPLLFAAARFAVILAIYIFLLGPIVIIVMSSLNGSDNASIALKAVSLRWYIEFWHNDDFVTAFRFSVYLGLAAAGIATMIGFLTSYATLKLSTGHGRLVRSAIMLPQIIPQILLSMSLLLCLTLVRLPPLLALLIGHILICLPFAVTTIIVSLEGLDPQIEAAALSLGASRLRVLTELILPLVLPGVFSAFVFSFVTSFGDVYVAMFLAGPGTTTLPVQIFLFMEWESSPVIAAITTLQVGLIFILGVIIEATIGLRKVMGM